MSGDEFAPASASKTGLLTGKLLALLGGELQESLGVLDRLHDLLLRGLLRHSMIFILIIIRLPATAMHNCYTFII